MRLESGPASGDRNRYFIILLMTLAFGLYFIYDGSYGYISKNRKKAVAALTSKVGMAEADLPKEFGEHPTKPEVEELMKDPPRDTTALQEKFGKPLHIQPGAQGETREYYVSDYGMLEIPVRFGAVIPDQIVWTKWANTKAEIENQFYWAIPCFVASLYAIVQLLSVMRVRVTIDDEQLTYTGQTIPLSQVKRFENFSPKGWVDLVYDGGSGEQKLRIDNYRVAKYDEILDTLVATTDLADPRPAKKAEDDTPGEETE